MAGLLLIIAALPAGDWPGWRGPKGDGNSDGAAPVRWSATENVAWKVDVPGVGHSSPIVVGGRLLLTSYLNKGDERLLLCYDKFSGKELWRATVLKAPAEKTHRSNTPASATPVSDGKHVWTTFADRDSIAVSCHDLSGKRVWQKKFAGWESRHGFCGSPVLFEGLVIVNGDSDGDAFLAGLDARTGEQRWRVPRPNKVRSFSMPLFVEAGGKTRMVLAGSQSVSAYGPLTGKQLWSIKTETQKFVATVAHADGITLATGTSPSPTMIGIGPDGKVVWSDSKGAAYVPSPLAVGKNFLVVSDKGLANLIVARTGKRLWTKRLGRQHDSSPLRIGKHVYCLDIDGTCWVLKASTEFEVVAKNALGEECRATPAVAGGQLFIRTAKRLWCVGKHPFAKVVSPKH